MNIYRYHIRPDSNRPDLKGAYVWASSHGEAATAYARRVGYKWSFPRPDLHERAVFVYGQDPLAEKRFMCGKHYGLTD